MRDQGHVRVERLGEDVTVDAGVEWDIVVQTSLEAGLAGLEPLSGIPGSAGGTPVQNVGAYGALTSDLLRRLTVYDRATGTTLEHNGIKVADALAGTVSAATTAAP